VARIAHIANLYGPKSGGLRTTVDALADIYVRQGHEVLSIVPGTRYDIVRSKHLTRVLVPGIRIPLSGGYRLILRTALVKQILEDFSPNILEISDRTTLIKVARWARSRGIATYFFAHERVDGVLKAFFPYLFFRKEIARVWNQHTYDSVDGIIATTNFAAAEFWELEAKKGKGVESKISQVPLGVYLEKFTPTTPELLLDNVEDKSCDYFFACTRLSKEKDPFFLLEIAEELKKTQQETLILVAGDGPMRKSLVKIAEEKNLNIHFLGFISDKTYLNHLMANAKVFLAVGPIETFGLAALESLASGTPVICRSSSAITEVIDESSGAALARNSQQWVAALTDFLKRDSHELSNTARNRAEEFPWDKCGKNLLELYRAVA
jgi:alpha-1,6-mannosyltransferase